MKKTIELYDNDKRKKSEFVPILLSADLDNHDLMIMVHVFTDAFNLIYTDL